MMSLSLPVYATLSLMLMNRKTVNPVGIVTSSRMRTFFDHLQQWSHELYLNVQPEMLLMRKIGRGAAAFSILVSGLMQMVFI